MSRWNHQTAGLGELVAATKRPRKGVYSTNLREDQVERLKALSFRTKVPQAELVRQALDLLFERREKE